MVFHWRNNVISFLLCELKGARYRLFLENLKQRVKCSRIFELMRQSHCFIHCSQQVKWNPSYLSFSVWDITVHLLNIIVLWIIEIHNYVYHCEIQLTKTKSNQNNILTTHGLGFVSAALFIAGGFWEMLDSTMLEKQSFKCFSFFSQTTRFNFI